MSVVFPIQAEQVSPVSTVVPASAPRTLRILQVGVSGTVGTDDMGPVSTDICALANGLERLGHTVTVSDAPAGRPRAGLNAGIQVISVSPATQRRRRRMFVPRIVSRLNLWACALAYVLALIRRVRLRDYDVVHVHHQRIAFLLGVATRVEYYYSSHTPLWALEVDQGIELGLGRRFEAWVERLAMAKAKVGIGLGDFMARAAPDLDIEKIPIGTDPSRWTRLDRQRSRAALKIPDDAFVVLFIGRLHPVKGVDVLIEAVRRLSPHKKRLSAIVIGPHGGNFQLRRHKSRYVEKLIQSAEGLPVEFTGFISNRSEQFLQYLSACDIAAFPSRLEPQGNVVMEALAMSTPVVASRTGGMAEIVTDEVGFLVPPGDVDALTKVLSAAYDDPAKLDDLARHCRSRIEASYSWERIVARHEELYKRTLGSARGPERERWQTG